MVVVFDCGVFDLLNLDCICLVVCEIWLMLIVNLVVYIVVDKVEQECDFVMVINGVVFGVFVEEVGKLGVLLIYYLIDYVFDGMKNGEYVEIDLMCL